MPNLPSFVPIVSNGIAMKALGGALKKLKKLKIGSGLGLGKRCKKFKAPSGKKFAVAQRSDIDWNKKRRITIDGKKKYVTNKVAAEKYGRAPIVTINGKNHRVTLHHHNQEPKGPLVEMLQSDHSKHHGALHPKTKSKIDREEFDKDRTAYWKERGKQAP